MEARRKRCRAVQGNVQNVTPRAFKAAIASFAPQFAGYSQQDSQELLAFLLDGLHEDLNRVQTKRYIEVILAPRFHRWVRSFQHMVATPATYVSYQAKAPCAYWQRLLLTMTQRMHLFTHSDSTWQDRDYTGQPDDEWAAEALENYRANNDSVIVDHFQVRQQSVQMTLAAQLVSLPDSGDIWQHPSSVLQNMAS